MNRNGTMYIHFYLFISKKIFHDDNLKVIVNSNYYYRHFENNTFKYSGHLDVLLILIYFKGFLFNKDMSTPKLFITK